MLQTKTAFYIAKLCWEVWGESCGYLFS